MNQKTYNLLSSTVLGLAAFFHLLRVSMGWPLIVGGYEVPVGLSALAILIAGSLTFIGFDIGKKHK